ncbi:MAG: rod shape-determining protein MreD [Atopobiaceae bacterium]|jgi:rod shape-determining protein MreD|nr:rod shape-determining protein MreD [Atopobiaceae bacterium]MCH4180072.1 rod shape-determining protein MreD [Atopobiaceae bacterium]MCH4213876.1 rod shape-determining protein MreD [Atopobiaceae bacterium]MCH4230114.1 rod shape-determining protein MreD [Atopobiaceae bacterium]MCH4275661.1 rod shape-determining protein MreD [Atopobiaceae bacterium]
MLVNDKNNDRRSFIILCVVCGVLQLALAPNVCIADGRANFALVLAACVAFGIGGGRGVVCGFAAGLFFDLATTGPIGLMALELTVFSFVAGSQERNRLSENPVVTFELFAAGALVVSLFYNLCMVIVGQASIVDALVFRTLPTTLLTCLAFLPFLYLLSRGMGSSPRLSRSSLGSSSYKGARRGAGHLRTKGL